MCQFLLQYLKIVYIMLSQSTAYCVDLADTLLVVWLTHVKAMFRVLLFIGLLWRVKCEVMRCAR